MARALGATVCVNSRELQKPVQKFIAGDLTKWGADYTFDCTGTLSLFSERGWLHCHLLLLTNLSIILKIIGNVDVMRAALESAHRGWGTSCVIGMSCSL